jgi:metal-responsive CopG/Arc/MetJ family transcriptional regulator
MARVLISLPDGFVELIDEAAELTHSNRSEFIRQACREKMERLCGGKLGDE